MSIHMSGKVWDEITYPLPNFNGLGMDKKCHPTLPVKWSLIQAGIKV